jgi:hypothetical protein
LGYVRVRGEIFSYRGAILRYGSVLAILGVFMTLVRLTVFMAAGTLLAGVALIAIASFVGL